MENLYAVEEEHGSFGLREILTVIFKHKVKIVTISVLTFLVVTLVALFQTSTYVAKSSVLVKNGREYINNPEVGDAKDMAAVTMPEIINAEIQIINNRGLAEKVVSTLMVEAMYPQLAKRNDGLAKAVERFQKDLTVDIVKNSSVINVSFRHKDPKIAANAVNLLIELFRDKHLEVFSGPRSSFLEKQLATYEQQLKETEKNFEGFKQKSRVFSLEEQRTMLLQQRVSLDTTLKDSQNRVDELSKKLATLTRQNQFVAQDKSLDSEADSKGPIAEAKSKLLALQLEEQQLLKKYNENSRMVVNVRKEIDMVRSYLKNQEEDSKVKAKSGNPVVQQVRIDLMKTEADLNSQRAKVAAVRGQLGQVDGEIQSLDRNAQQFQSLKREVATTEKNYQTYLNKAEEARLSEDLNRQKIANLSILQTATPPAEPLPKKRLQKILLGFVAGLVLGIGGAFLLEILSPTLSSPEVVEKRLGLPVLAAISYREFN